MIVIHIRPANEYGFLVEHRLLFLKTIIRTRARFQCQASAGIEPGGRWSISNFRS